MQSGGPRSEVFIHGCHTMAVTCVQGHKDQVRSFTKEEVI